MGSLVVGQPALRLEIAVSIPLDLVSSLSLLFRAVPGSDLDPWLWSRPASGCRRNCGTSSIYCTASPAGASTIPKSRSCGFEPLRPDHLDASFDDLLAFLEATPAEDYVDMVAHALERVHADLELRGVAHN